MVFKNIFHRGAQQLGGAPRLGHAPTGPVRRVPVEYLGYMTETGVTQVVAERRQPLGRSLASLREHPLKLLSEFLRTKDVAFALLSFQEVAGCKKPALFAKIHLFGALAQLARAPHLQCGGHRFESDMLHHGKIYLFRGVVAQLVRARH